MNTTLSMADEGERQFTPISRRYGVRSVLHGPGSAESQRGERSILIGPFWNQQQWIWPSTCAAAAAS